MTTILEQLAGRIATRRERYATKEVRGLPGLAQLSEPYIPSNFSLLLRQSRRRYVRKSTGVRVAEFIESPTAIARDYLALTYRRGPDLRSSQADAIRATIKRFPAFPHYATPVRFDDGFYVDVRRAFFSIMLAVGWNVSYFPNRFLGYGRPPRDFPFPDSPVARNSLVSVSQSREMVEFMPQTHSRHVLTTFNPLLNESISALIRDVLNSIAADALAAGAVYANTDGYIAPDARTAQRILQAVRDWGLDARIKARGPGAVRGDGNYKVGDLATDWFYRSDLRTQSVQSIATVEYKRWLQHTFQHIAARNQ